MEIQPDSFDLVVVGTGLQESLIAAAASLSGKTVLHLDPQSEYGSLWAGLTLDRFLEWTSQHAALAPREAELSSAEAANGPPNGASAAELAVHDSTEQIYSEIEVTRQEGMDLGNFRQLNIDLAPKLLYTVGPMADALLRCKADNYLVFRLIPSFTWQQGRPVSVPASRGDIFKSQSLSPAEKRVLMRFLKSMLEAFQGEGPLAGEFDERPFEGLLESQGVPAALRQVVLYSLAILDVAQGAEESHSSSQPDAKSSESAAGTSGLAVAQEDRRSQTSSPEAESASTRRVPSRQALERLKLYVGSVSRHGGAFMVPDYGAGELPQAFCRVAAVQGTLYVLRCGITAVLLDDASRDCIGVRTATGQIIHCKGLAAAPHHLPAEFIRPAADSRGVSRAVAVLQSPIASVSDTEAAAQSSQMLLTFPPESVYDGVPRNPVRVLQLGSHSSISPSGRYVLHLSTVDSESSKADLHAVLSTLLGEESPLLSVIYKQKTQIVPTEELPSNVALCQPPDETVGYGSAIQNAEACFVRLFPGEDFLPPLPLPTDNSDTD